MLLDIKTYRKMIADLEELEDIADAREIQKAISNGEPTMSWDEHLKKTKEPVSRGSSKLVKKYAIEIFYSDEDDGYIALAPELAGCSSFGETPEKALKEAKLASQLWLETALKEKRNIPEPSKKELLTTFIKSRA